MNYRKITRFAFVLVARIACLGKVSAAEPMVERTYPDSDVLRSFLNSAEYAGIEIEGNGDKAVQAVLEMLGVEWPDGSSIRAQDYRFSCLALNTSANLAKLDALLKEFEVNRSSIEVEVCFVEAGRAALGAVGYFDTNRVDAAVLKERLMSRGDARLLESPRVVTRSGCEAVVKNVREYIYPQDYDVRPYQNVASGTNAPAHVLAAVEPQNFTMREVGSIVDVTPSLDGSGEMVSLELKLSLVDEPE